jgi:hypothetical protein
MFVFGICGNGHLQIGYIHENQFEDLTVVLVNTLLKFRAWSYVSTIFLSFQRDFKKLWMSLNKQCGSFY